MDGVPSDCGLGANDSAGNVAHAGIAAHGGRPSGSPERARAFCGGVLGRLRCPGGRAFAPLGLGGSRYGLGCRFIGDRPVRRGLSRRSSRPCRGAGTPWLYLAPALVVLGGLLVYPVYQLGLISLFEYTQAQVSGGEPATFQGVGNYAELFGDAEFWRVLLATVVFAAACVVSTLAVGCALAVLLT